jgi:hypothetical protein
MGEGTSTVGTILLIAFVLFMVLCVCLPFSQYAFMQLAETNGRAGETARSFLAFLDALNALWTDLTAVFENFPIIGYFALLLILLAVIGALRA